VWFDSGSSHLAVLAKRPELTWPADMYLEGTDQHRGWFQSSLLLGIGARDAAPYRSVLTHGFVVDEQGRKMSKSLGNVIAPQQIIKDSGAEVLRLWVAMVDYRDEIGLSREILARTVEAYRKIRNTFRYLLSNLYDFDPSANRLPVEAMLEVDRFALSRYERLLRKVRTAWDAYDFQTIFQAVNEFVTVDLSAFYLDVSKDRLYTFHADAPARRSAQTAQYVMADGLARLIAPILSVTAEEVWLRLPGGREESVHLADFPSADDARLDAGVETRWGRLLDVRDQVNAVLEGARQRKEIGNALAAHVTVSASGDLADLLDRHAADLPMLFITSSVDVVRLESGDGVTVEVVRSSGEKCPRCWRFVPSTITSGELAGLCGRCADALGGLSASA
jgi:isoleucyl-tRNA synthetase